MLFINTWKARRLSAPLPKVVVSFGTCMCKYNQSCYQYIVLFFCIFCTQKVVHNKSMTTPPQRIHWPILYMLPFIRVPFYLLALFKSLTNSADCWCRISLLFVSLSKALTSSCTLAFSFFSLKSTKHNYHVKPSVWDKRGMHKDTWKLQFLCSSGVRKPQQPCCLSHVCQSQCSGLDVV